MGNQQWTSAFLSYTPTASPVAAANFPIENIASLAGRPQLRVFRSTVVTQQDIIVDFGSSKSVVATALLNANFASVQLAHSPDNVTYTDYTGSPFTIAINKPRGGRYHLFVAFSFTKRYVRIRIPAQTPVDSAAYFSLGLALFSGTLNTLLANPQAPTVESLTRVYLRSGEDITPAGSFMSTQEWQTLLRPGEETQLFDIALLGEHTPFLLFNNQGKSEEVSLWRYTGGLEARSYSGHMEINPRFREMV